MSKRRRTPSVASREQEDEELDQTLESLRKRKKLLPTELCQQIYDTIRSHKKEDGTLLCDTFIRMPKRRQEPAYHEIVSNPIDLIKIQQKLKTAEYHSPDEFGVDIELLVNNAKSFYKRISQEYRDACELWDLFITTKTKLMDADVKAKEETDSKGKSALRVSRPGRKSTATESRKQDPDTGDISESSTNPDDERTQYEDLFTAIMTATDSDNRMLHTCFQLLPSKKHYPEYYDVIENPVDLKMIATRIQRGKYQSLNDMEKDLLLMTRNACHFNEPGSQIYKDAKALRKIITAKKSEVEHGKYIPSKASRNKRSRGGQSLSAITAALRDEDESDEGEPMYEEDVGDADNPQWQLYECVKNATNNHGHHISEPFWKLPSKRYYPDYYKEIKNPVSLSQISNKLKRGDYGTVSEVAGDLNIMFENAKKYNRADSRLYKDAVKLQNVMQAKVLELLEIHEDSESEDESEEHGGRRKSPRRTAVTIPKSSRLRDDLTLKKRLQTLFKCLIDHVREDGRQPILVFMEKPSKKLYPDYFQVIAEPIDMLTIEANIKNDKYGSEEELLADFKLLFNNCRQYNEEGSMIYEDANKLEEVLMVKVKELGPMPESTKKSIKGTKPRKSIGNLPVLAQKLRALYDTIRDYKDPKNRQLSMIFQKLPSKVEYPDYYEVIKQPIDLEKISQKLKANQYESVDDMVSDFVLMFDNACKYNEPDSQIYKDALMLQQVTLQTKLQLREDEESVPDVTLAVQELLTSLFISVYNHQDEEGRCYSDSMAELPEHDDVDGVKVRALSLDLVKRRLDRGLYRRLDVFQEDIFACMERARRLSRTDSQVFEDSVELQSYFIQQRDELCRGGDLLQSPALIYTANDLAASVETTRQCKFIEEQPEEETETRSSDDSLKVRTDVGDCMSFNQQTYRVGDFVYVEPKERGMESSIMHIERLWTNQEGQQMMYGNYYYRPNETYHVTTRKFLEKEVFKSDIRSAFPLNQVLGLCCVLNVKDYFRSKPEGFEEKDVYVCESRYSSKARAFKKIKVWPCSVSEHIRLVPRDEVLDPKRVMSVFRDRVEKHKEEIAELEEREKFVEKEKPNVVLFNPHGQEGLTYYEQYSAPGCLLRTGDFVYARSGLGRRLISQVDSIWTDTQGFCFFCGPLLMNPSDIPTAPTQPFYKQEVLLCAVEDTYPIENIVGRCAVLEHTEYISCRPTEIPEQDVYLCESMYDGACHAVRKLQGEAIEGLKKYTHSSGVTEDEIYFFRRLINPPKIEADSASAPAPTELKPLVYEMEPSPVIQKNNDTEMLIVDDSLDGGPPSVGSADILTPTSNVTPVSSRKKSSGKKLVTGYILYSSDVRRTVAANNPESTFGDISRIVGNEWRNLPAHEKQSWEEKAAKVNEETAAKLAEAEACPSPGPLGSGGPDVIYECCWENCDWQFEDVNDCMEHSIHETNGHVQMYFAAIPSGECEFQCQWRGCTRARKSAPPFPHVVRLARHIKEVHIQKGNGRIIPPHERSRNFVPSRRRMLLQGRPQAPAYPPSYPHAVMSNATQILSSTQQVFSHETPSLHAQYASCSGVVNNAASTSQQRPFEPLFVSVPPRPHRVLHSEAYIKYIESLHTGSKHISSWEKHLNATQENTPVPDPSRLPVHWLGNGVGNHGNILNALWTLRDFMLRDAIGLSSLQ